MSEIKIDQREIDGLIKNANSFIEMLIKVRNELGDKDEDLFIRYMGYCRLKAIVHYSRCLQKLVLSTLQMGHDMHDPMLQTPKCKETGWDVVNLESNNFFTDDQTIERQKGIEIEISHITGELKEKVKELILEAEGKKEEPLKH